MSLQTTSWQTVGPYFRIGLERLFQNDIAGEGVWRATHSGARPCVRRCRLARPPTP